MRQRDSPLLQSVLPPSHSPGKTSAQVKSNCWRLPHLWLRTPTWLEPFFTLNSCLLTAPSYCISMILAARRFPNSPFNPPTLGSQSWDEIFPMPRSCHHRTCQPAQVTLHTSPLPCPRRPHPCCRQPLHWGPGFLALHLIKHVTPVADPCLPRQGFPLSPGSFPSASKLAANSSFLKTNTSNNNNHKSFP